MLLKQWTYWRLTLIILRNKNSAVPKRADSILFGLSHITIGVCFFFISFLSLGLPKSKQTTINSTINYARYTTTTTHSSQYPYIGSK